MTAKPPPSKKKSSKRNLSKKPSLGTGDTPAFTQITDPKAIAEILAVIGPFGPRGLELPPKTKWVELFTKPLPANWGPERLKRFLTVECGIDVAVGRAFLFFNKSKSQLKLYFRDDQGDQMLVKALRRGGFMVPVPDPSQDFIKVPRAKLEVLFRS